MTGRDERIITAWARRSQPSSERAGRLETRAYGRWAAVRRDIALFGEEDVEALATVIGRERLSIKPSCAARTPPHTAR